MNTTSQRAIVLALVAALLVLTRLHLPTTFGHIGPLPDASWAAFFIGGYYLRNWSRWAFPLFMAAAVVVDYVVISGQGINFWTHYCVSAAYWFLVPAYLAMWAGGALVRRYQTARHGRTLALLIGSLLVSATACHLLSQGSFYWLSPVVSEPTFAGWWKNFSDWYVPYLRVAAIYVGLAVIVHVMVEQVVRLAKPHGRTAD